MYSRGYVKWSAGAVKMTTFGRHELDAVSVENIALVFLGEAPLFTYGGNDVSDLVYDGGAPRSTEKPTLKGADGKPVPELPMQPPVLRNRQLLRRP